MQEPHKETMPSHWSSFSKRLSIPCAQVRGPCDMEATLLQPASSIPSHASHWGYWLYKDYDMEWQQMSWNKFGEKRTFPNRFISNPRNKKWGQKLRKSILKQVMPDYTFYFLCSHSLNRHWGINHYRLLLQKYRF